MLFHEKRGKTEGFSINGNVPVIETMVKLIKILIWKSTRSHLKKLKKLGNIELRGDHFRNCFDRLE